MSRAPSSPVDLSRVVSTIGAYLNEADLIVMGWSLTGVIVRPLFVAESAAENGNLELLIFLEDFWKKQKHKEKIFFLSVRGGQTHVYKKMRSIGLPFSWDVIKNSPCSGNLDFFKYIFEHEDVGDLHSYLAKAGDRNMILKTAIEKNRLSIAKYICDTASFPIDTEDKQIAFSAKTIEAVKLLHERGFIISKRVFYYFVHTDDISVIEWFASNGFIIMGFDTNFMGCSAAAFRWMMNKTGDRSELPMKLALDFDRDDLFEILINEYGYGSDAPDLE